MAIFEIEDGYVISSHQVWVPGIFDSHRAAKYMFRFSPCDQYQMWEDWTALKNVIPTPPMSFEDMKKWKNDKADREAKYCTTKYTPCRAVEWQTGWHRCECGLLYGPGDQTLQISPRRISDG